MGSRGLLISGIASSENEARAALCLWHSVKISKSWYDDLYGNVH